MCTIIVFAILVGLLLPKMLFYLANNAFNTDYADTIPVAAWAPGPSRAETQQDETQKN